MIAIAVICEDRGHFEAVCHLADGTLVDGHPWLDGILDVSRRWRGFNEQQSWSKFGEADEILSQLPRIGRQHRHGYIAGEALKPEAAMWRKVLLALQHGSSPPEAVILVRDLDRVGEGNNRSDRRAGAEQVRGKLMWSFQIALALAEPEVEAWHVAGFVACGDDERAQLDALRKELAFDPTTDSHRLSSHPNDSPRDAKRVLRRLCGHDEPRRERCLEDRGLLRERGKHNGLARFLDELEEHILPLFGHRPQVES
ncbi:MAG: hypothetical protein RBU37_18415 [Myxococcota bacterium]|jgi:hypothetical protein|nr:hypothetical protein [Myxococcota bacterium]